MPVKPLPQMISGDWDSFMTGAGQLASVAAAGTWILQTGAATPNPPIISTAALAGNAAFFHLDPTTNYAITGKVIQCRVVGTVITNATAPAITLTFGLYPISSVAALVPTLGAVTTGSTAAIATPAINTMTTVYSSIISMPATGHYVLACLTSGSNGSGATPLLRAILQTRAN